MTEFFSAFKLEPNSAHFKIYGMFIIFIHSFIHLKLCMQTIAQYAHNSFYKLFIGEQELVKSNNGVNNKVVELSSSK
jgi:hypothetical protein